MTLKPILCVSSLIPWFNSLTKNLEKRGGLSGPRVWSIQELDSKALAEGLKANSTLTNLSLAWNQIAVEGAKAWCLARMVRKKGMFDVWCFLCFIIHPSAGEIFKKGGMRWPRVWSIQELDSRSIGFLVSGLGRRPERELYFDQLEFAE